MTREEDLVRAICEDPADDAPRLTYCDWLEERERGERAEFIRVQCGLTDLDLPPCHCNALTLILCQRCRLQVRERELLQANAGQWFPVPGLIACSVWDHSPTVRWFPEGNSSAGSDYSFGGDTSRGFVASIRLPAAAFLRHAGAVFSRHPVTKVVLTDKRPHEGSTVVFFREGDAGDVRADEPHYVPAPLWRLMAGRGIPDDRAFSHKGYLTTERANTALSAGCCTYGRSLAGLGPLREAVTTMEAS